MTGLNPDIDVVVEIATLVTDDDLNVIAEGPDFVIHHSDDVLAIMDPFVVQMHTESGLLPLIRESRTTVDDAARLTLDFIRTHVTEARTVPLCGNSIGTDRRFLAKYMPEIEAFLHYRSVDVSSVKELCKRWYPTVTIDRPSKDGAHRALNDIHESVRELRFYRDSIFTTSAGGNGPPAPRDTAANH